MHLINHYLKRVVVNRGEIIVRQQLEDHVQKGWKYYGASEHMISRGRGVKMAEYVNFRKEKYHDSAFLKERDAINIPEISSSLPYQRH